MGYRTVKAVPTLRTYEDAKRWWERTKPIRGRNIDLRPLAERRYADTYSIRKNPSNEAIECVLYKTPVVTFMPDGEIHVRNGGWPTTSTHMFIHEVLYQVADLRGVGGKTTGKVNGQVFTLGSNEVLKLKRDEGGRLNMLDAQTHYDYRMNRKASNNVRQRYKPFMDYFDGFIKLRTHERSMGFGQVEAVGCTIAELTEVFGAREWRHNTTVYKHINTSKYNLLTKKAPQTYKESMAEFMGLITDVSDNQYASFYKAAVILCGYDKRLTIVDGVADMNATQWVSAEMVRKMLNEVLLKWHAKEVLEEYELPEGKVPSSKYVHWFMEEENT